MKILKILKKLRFLVKPRILKNTNIFLKWPSFFKKWTISGKPKKFFKKLGIFRKTHRVKFYNFLTKIVWGKSFNFGVFGLKKVKTLSCRARQRVCYKSIIFDVSWGTSYHLILDHFYPSFLLKNRPLFFQKTRGFLKKDEFFKKWPFFKKWTISGKPEIFF